MEELLIQKGGYMSNRCFNFRDYDLQYEIQTSYPLPEWEYARGRLHNDKITMSAVTLSKRIKDELKIDVFPYIHTLAIKGYKDDGQVKFEMFGKKYAEYYYFDLPRKYYNLKRAKLKLERYNGDDVITLEFPPSPKNNH